MTAGKSLPGKTLYDQLCARPDDDAEAIQIGFRRAAKANHPDLNPGDPQAAKRFQQIAAAYAILRDPKQREAYDRLLAYERQQQEAHDQLVVSTRAKYRAQLRRTVVMSAAAVIAVSIGLVGSYALIVRPSMLAKTDGQDTPSERLPNLAQIEVLPRPVALAMSGRPLPVAVGKLAEIKTPEITSAENKLIKPSGVSDNQAEPAKTDIVELADRPALAATPTPAAKSDIPLKIASGDPAPNASETKNDTGKGAGTLDPRIVDRDEEANVANEKNRNEVPDPIDRSKVLTGETQPSLSETDAGIVRPSSAKLRIPLPAKRPVIERPLVRQAAVESRYISQVAAAESPSTPPPRPPPLFGVGF
jgi:hypothetical protein